MKYNMFSNNMLRAVIATGLLMLAVMPVDVLAQITYAPNFSDPTGGQGLKKGLTDVLTWVWYVFYLLGGVMMGAAAFKLKQGDLAGFAKCIGGSVALFLAPAAVKVIMTLGNAASTGN